jgi:hypothetical protein
MTRLSPSDPLCLSPALAGVRTGAVALGDPRLEVSASQLAGYLANAPTPAELDRLEVRAGDDVRVIRQGSPGRYVYVRCGGEVYQTDTALGRFVARGVR